MNDQAGPPSEPPGAFDEVEPSTREDDGVIAALANATREEPATHATRVLNVGVEPAVDSSSFATNDEEDDLDGEHTRPAALAPSSETTREVVLPERAAAEPADAHEDMGIPVPERRPERRGRDEDATVPFQTEGFAAEAASPGVVVFSSAVDAALAPRDQPSSVDAALEASEFESSAEHEMPPYDAGLDDDELADDDPDDPFGSTSDVSVFGSVRRTPPSAFSGEVVASFAGSLDDAEVLASFEAPDAEAEVFASFASPFDDVPVERETVESGDEVIASFTSPTSEVAALPALDPLPEITPEPASTLSAEALFGDMTPPPIVLPEARPPSGPVSSRPASGPPGPASVFPGRTSRPPGATPSDGELAVLEAMVCSDDPATHRAAIPRLLACAWSPRIAARFESLLHHAATDVRAAALHALWTRNPVLAITPARAQLARLAREEIEFGADEPVIVGVILAQDPVGDRAIDNLVEGAALGFLQATHRRRRRLQALAAAGYEIATRRSLASANRVARREALEVDERWRLRRGSLPPS
ncbi:MAG: hypothetical protein H6723_08980 [Sandaracinus sp.]|nr:hypothetical protein [Sandaracinus sp.]